MTYDEEKAFFSLAPSLPNRRLHRLLGLVGLLITGTVGRYYFTSERPHDVYYNLHSFFKSRVQVDNLIEQLLSPSLIGLDVSYIEHELSVDFANYGGWDVTIDPQTGSSRAAGYHSLAISIPKESVTSILPLYEGLRCSSPFPLSVCPFPGQCPPPAPDAKEKVRTGPSCAVWAQGRPASLKTALDTGEMVGLDKGFNGRQVWDWDRSGLWKDQYWQPLSSPSAKRPYHYFTPAETNQCLSGRRILFLGDSMVRQSFSRLISYIRGIPTSCEHSSGSSPAAYYVFPNGTDLYEPNVGYGSHPDALFTVFYEFHGNGRDGYDKIISSNVDTVFNGIVYSTPSSEDLFRLQTGIERVFSRGWRGAFTWYLTPQKSHRDRHEYYPRNNHMREFIRELRGNHTDIALNSIPADLLTTRSAGFKLLRNRLGDRHPDQFGCSFNTVYPDLVNPGLSSIFAPLGFDNRDLYNFNVVQLWLNGICDIPNR